jgi:hypothetical protein
LLEAVGAMAFRVPFIDRTAARGALANDVRDAIEAVLASGCKCPIPMVNRDDLLVSRS